MKGKFLGIIIFIVIFSSNQMLSQGLLSWNKDTSYYLYKIDYLSNTEKLIAEKITFDINLTKKQILDSLASFLSQTFFVTENKFFESKKKIKISIQKIIKLNLPERKCLIAVVNIDDQDQICMTTYFQGTTGGNNTFLMLVSNLMQPQLEFPLIDGVIILYNGTELKNMDHINLEGLISEREIDKYIRIAIQK